MRGVIVGFVAWLAGACVVPVPPPVDPRLPADTDLPVETDDTDTPIDTGPVDPDGDDDGDGIRNADDACPGRDDLAARDLPDPPDDRFEDSNCDGIDGVRDGSVFVSATGSADGAGTIDDPLSDLAGALARGAAQGVPVLVAAGGYTGPFVITQGVSVHGGYDPRTWARSDEARVVLRSPPPCLSVVGVSGPVVLDRIDVQAGNGAQPGSPSIAAVIRDSANVTWSKSELRAGDGRSGTPGPAGVSGATGFPGSDGGDGCDEAFTTPEGLLCSSPARGAFGVPPTCADGATPGAGGVGGRSGFDNDAGDAGDPGAAGSGARGGAGGPGGAGGAVTDYRCPCGIGVLCDPVGTGGTSGAPGAPGGGGAVGAAGAPGSPDGVVDRATGLWSGTVGTGGEPGGPGGGGGGGGGAGGGECSTLCCFSDHGGAGGGGGSGGCGGLGGRPGLPGGASIALVSVGSAPRLVDLVLRTGNGGRGGDGGAGGQGATGGGGGAGGDGFQDTPGGSPGGVGGRGGDGGVGGAGTGGPVVGLWVEGTAPVLQRVTFSLGAAGAGGIGGGGMAPAGTVYDVRVVP